MDIRIAADEAIKIIGVILLIGSVIFFYGFMRDCNEADKH